MIDETLRDAQTMEGATYRAHFYEEIIIDFACKIIAEAARKDRHPHDRILYRLFNQLGPYCVEGYDE